MTLIDFFRHFTNALQWGSIYALIALGYSMVYGILMLFNFAHGDVFMVGAYIGMFVSTGLVALSTAGIVVLPPGAILLLTIVFCMILNSFVGMTIERVAYRPLRNAPRSSAAITGLMVGIMLETGNLILLGAQRRKYPVLIDADPIRIGGVAITITKLIIIIVSLLLMVLLYTFIKKSKWGMAMRAMAYDFFAVHLMGVPINAIALMTFALGSALAGSAGVFVGLAYPVLEPYMGMLIGWKAFVAAVLGGRGSVVGAAIAGYLLGFIEIFVAAVFPSTLRDLIAYGIILIILIVRPHGFFGEAFSSRLRL